MALLSLPVCLIFNEHSGLMALGITAAACLACGQALHRLVRSNTGFHKRHAMLTAALAWLVISLFGALPFVLGGGINPLDAAFESVSGFTGTGLTVLEASALPHYLQWWRSLSQWVGGIGVILLMMTILPPQQGALDLYLSEARQEKLLPSVRSTARAIWSIYGVYSLLAVALLWLAGVPAWQAINHGLTAISTGGFTITNDSLEQASSVAKLMYMPIMVAGAISFFAHYRVMRERRPGIWFIGSEYRLFWIVLIAGAGLMACNSFMLQESAWLDSALQWVAAMTTTGFQAMPLQLWHPSTWFLLALAMCVGGMAGSTTGGIKLLRLVLLYKSIIWNLADVTRQPHEIVRLTFDGEALTRGDAQARIRGAAALTYAWIVVASIAVLLMSYCVPPGTPLQLIIFDVLSAQSGEGLSSGLVSAELNAGGKLVLMTVMWMGRLEIIPVLVLLAMLVQSGRRKRYA
ncbi:MAG TPA: TrkH family potassium uptake protein [Salinisphaeraceae bacterium]|nr:TrkH family potassium uptake protein [Salinisphaeraceae bacterium]